MNYLEAKTVLLKNNPQIPFTLVAAEIATLVSVAAILVWFFA
jgi:hypothetical protein